MGNHGGGGGVPETKLIEGDPLGCARSFRLLCLLPGRSPPLRLLSVEGALEQEDAVVQTGVDLGVLWKGSDQPCQDAFVGLALQSVLTRRVHVSVPGQLGQLPRVLHGRLGHGDVDKVEGPLGSLGLSVSARGSLQKVQIVQKADDVYNFCKVASQSEQKSEGRNTEHCFGSWGIEVLLWGKSVKQPSWY